MKEQDYSKDFETGEQRPPWRWASKDPSTDIGAILQRGESLISGKSRAPKDRCPIVGREVSYEALIFRFRIQLDIGGLAHVRSFGAGALWAHRCQALPAPADML